MQKYIKTLSTAVLLVGTLSAMAQKNISQNIEEKDGKLKIHVETTEKGQKQVFDRTYNAEGMNAEQKENLINHITDSLFAANGDQARKQIRIKVDRNDDLAINEPRSARSPRKNQKRIEIYKDGKKIEKKFDDNDQDELEFEFNDGEHDNLLGSLHPMMKEFKFNFDGDFKNFDPFNESKTVKALNIYPNKPFDNKLNLKFYTPEKGDVNIIVTDINGKEIGSQKFKDFQGEFMGQVELKKNTKGTVFVTVTQGEDGTAKRVVIE